MAAVEDAAEGGAGAAKGLDEQSADLVVAHHAGRLVVDGDKRLIAAVGLAGAAGRQLAAVAGVVEVELVAPSGAGDEPAEGGGDVRAGRPGAGEPVVGGAKGAGPGAVVQHANLVVEERGADGADVNDVVDAAGQLGGLAAVVDPDEKSPLAGAVHAIHAGQKSRKQAVEASVLA